MFALINKLKQVIVENKNENNDNNINSDEEVYLENRQIDECKLPEKKLEMPTEEIEKLRNYFPDLFLEKEKKLLATIVQATNEALKVKLEQKGTDMRIELTQNIKTEFAHEIDDYVYVECYAKTEELFNGQFKEELIVHSIRPAYKRKNIKCTVLEINDDHAVLNFESFINKNSVEQFSDLSVGDILQVDLIESKKSNFKWRGVRFVHLKTKAKDELLSSLKKDYHINPTKGNSIRLLPPSKVGRLYNYEAKLCEYANQVFSNSQEPTEIIPSSLKTSTTSRRFKAVRLAFFEIPLDMRMIYFKKYDNFKDWRNDLEKNYIELKQELSYENYYVRFKALLWLEEIELFKNFRQYDCERAQFTREADYLALTIKNLAERRPSLVMGDKVRAYPIKDGDTEEVDTTTTNINSSQNYNNKIHLHDYDHFFESSDSPKICFEGNICGVQCDKILIKFNSAFQAAYNGESYRLEFFFSRLGFRRKHYAILKITKDVPKHYLFPNELRLRDKPQLDVRLNEEAGLLHTPNAPIKWYNSSLNLHQQRAVYNILRGEAHQMPYIIFGPPGTGKTITLVETILQLVSNLPQSRILVGTPSNSAANLICGRLIETKGLHVGEMIRLVSFNSLERDQIPDELLKYCATADMGEEGTHESETYTTADGVQMNCSMSMLARVRVTVGTCSMLGKYMELGFPSNHFTHILIDEAGQCMEPDAMIVINQVSTDGQVILAGDPKQLPAIVINKYAENLGLSKSFLERLLELKPYRIDNCEFVDFAGYNPILVTQLLYNYRSLPSILRIYSYLFYELKLIPMITGQNIKEAQLLRKLKNIVFESEKRPKDHGAYFIAVRGENIRERDSPSWCNPREANVVFQMAYKLYLAGIKPDSIGIISPYMKQVKLIRTLFSEANIKPPKIGSVEEFQGQERDIILISTVRTTRRDIMNYDFRYRLGFIRSESRMNVAISRARAMLMVFGDPEILELDNCWGVYINECKSNDSYYGIDNDNTNGVKGGDEITGDTTTSNDKE